MKMLTFREGDRLKLGVRVEGGVVDLQAARDEFGTAGVACDPASFFADPIGALPAARDLAATAIAAARRDDARGTPTRRPTWLLDESSIAFGPCVPNPRKIVCIGLNYRRHAAEAGMQPPETPVLFSKFANAIAASGDPIPLPSLAVEYDYEAELAVVIGRRAKYVPESRALDHIAGYCNANDLSARDLQLRTSQWLLGKSLDAFLPIGPYLVTADEIDDPQRLPIRAWLNGHLRQDSSTSDMIFSVAQIVNYVSRHMTLEPGDILTTGTPEGVIFGRKNETKDWMKPGDEITIEIGPLGRLVNTMVREEASPQ